MVAGSFVCFFIALVLWRLRPSDVAATYSLTINDQATGVAIRKAETWIQRQVGLLNHSDLPSAEGLYLVPSRKIHTLGMAFPLDILFVDRSGIVVDVICNVPPGLTGLKGPKGTQATMELKAGTIGTQLPVRVGDRLSLAAHDV